MIFYAIENSSTIKPRNNAIIANNIIICAINIAQSDEYCLCDNIAIEK